MNIILILLIVMPGIQDCRNPSHSFPSLHRTEQGESIDTFYPFDLKLNNQKFPFLGAINITKRHQLSRYGLAQALYMQTLLGIPTITGAMD